MPSAFIRAGAVWLLVMLAPFVSAADRILYLDPPAQSAAAGHDRFVAELRRQGLAHVPIERRVLPADNADLAAVALGKEGIAGSVIVTAHTELARAAARLHPDTSIVLVTLADPRDLGFIAADGSRTANVTGFTYFVPYEMKHVELLQEAAPHIRRLGILADRHWSTEPLSQRLVREGQALFGLKVRLFVYDKRGDIPRILASEEASAMEAWFVPDSPGSRMEGHDIARRVVAMKRPSIGGHLSHLEGGGLMVYEPAPVDHWVRAAILVRSVLGGTPAREIAFDRPSVFSLSINARAARHLGLKLPASLLKKADVVSQ